MTRPALYTPEADKHFVVKPIKPSSRPLEMGEQSTNPEMAYVRSADSAHKDLRICDARRPPAEGLALVEYLEEHPLMLNRPGMAMRAVNYIKVLILLTRHTYHTCSPY